MEEVVKKIAPRLSRGAVLIAEERQRQVEKEGWSPKHDDEHDKGDLLRAGAAYSRLEQISLARKRQDPDEKPAERLAFAGRLARVWWPWEQDFFKPSEDPIRNLQKAGALIAAEIDRLLRLQEREQGN